jgi:FecR protein
MTTSAGLNILKLVLGFACLLISQVVFAQTAGTVTFVTGDVNIVHADKTVAPATKNAALIAGDTIETNTGRLQLSMIDGGKVSLQPNTIYKINKYEFSGKEDGSESAFTELIKGGLRTVSGLIGHKNRDRYQLKTAVATIGIRGTEFTVNFNDNQLLMTTNFGSVDVCNAGGCLNAMTGQSIVVAGVGAAPKPSSKAAKAAAAPPASNKAVFTASDVITSAGLPLAVTQATNTTAAPLNFTGETIVSLATMQNGSNNNGVYVGNTTFSGNAGNGKNEAAGNSPNGNALITFTETSGTRKIVTGSTEVEAYNDGIVKWGRASGGTYNSQAMLMTTWITGTASPASALANLSGTYDVSASTAPYMVSNNVVTSIGAPNSVTGNLNIDFSQYSFTYTITVPIAGAMYTQNSSGSLIAGSPIFRDISSSAGALSGGSIIEGSLYGVNAQTAGINYGFSVSGSGTSGGTSNVYGNAVLQRNIP